MEPSTSCQLSKKYEFSASTGWITEFLVRYALHMIKIKCDTPSTNELAAKVFPEELSIIIKDVGCTPYQVRNADRSSLFLKRLLNRTHVAKL